MTLKDCLKTCIQPKQKGNNKWCLIYLFNDCLTFSVRLAWEVNTEKATYRTIYRIEIE